VKDPQREIPKIARHLVEIIRATEGATHRVLEQSEDLVEEQRRKDIQRRSQGHAMNTMAATEFQDLGTQEIQKLIGRVTEVESRLLTRLVMFRIEDEATEDKPTDPILERGAKNESALAGQELADQLLHQFQASGA
jgi:chemotaxis regulatin CheY-phosphate phosphatase CheZ